MKNTGIVSVLIIVLCSLVLVGSVIAATDPVITRAVFGSAGEPITDGNLYIINSTLGEPIVSNHVVETSHGLSSGYWAKSIINPGSANPSNAVYVPLVLKNP